MSAQALPGSTPPMEATLWNRLIAVAAAVFAVPVLVELLALAGGNPTPEAVRLHVAVAAGIFALASLGALYGLARRKPELRLARRLALVLAAQALLLGTLVPL